MCGGVRSARLSGAICRSRLDDCSRRRVRQSRLPNFAVSRRGWVLIAPLTGAVLVAVSRIVSLGADAAGATESCPSPQLRRRLLNGLP